MAVSTLFATTPEELFVQGNTAFASGKYAEAIQNYESIVAQGCHSVPVFYNLANACFRDGKIGRAILNYERANWLAPNDADIKANLRFTRQAAGLFEPSVVWWQVVPRTLSLNAWSWLLTISYFLICGTLTVQLLKPDVKRRARLFLLLWALPLIVSILSVMIQISDLDRAVVLVFETPLRVAPIENSPSPFTLTEGSIVRVQKQRGAFVYVRAEDGKTGWVTETQAQQIVSK